MLKDWLIGNMGVQGEYQYQAIHLYSTLAVAAAVAAVAFLASRKGVNKRRLLVAVCVFQLVFEVLWRIIYLFVARVPVAELWPMYPCNLGGILIPIIALSKWKTGKKMFYLFGFVGGLITFALPEGIFTTEILTFPILKSILQHTGLLMIPAIEYVSGTFRASLRHLGWCVLGCCIHVINCEGIDRLLGLTGDYIFFRSGMPFVIPGVPQFITLSVFAVLVLALLSFLSDRKGSIEFIKIKKQVT